MKDPDSAEGRRLGAAQHATRNIADWLRSLAASIEASTTGDDHAR